MISLLRSSEQKTNSWSGGTTTQLAIWPPDADYRDRNFLWRISSARVDQNESVFTALPGFHRILMILEGSIRLIHEGRREVELKPFEQDSFEGGWTTGSIGQCVDFNLMTAPECEGRVEALEVSSGQELRLKLFEGPETAQKTKTFSFESFYCLAPRLRVRISGDADFEDELAQNDFLTIREGNPHKKLLLRFSADTEREEKRYVVVRTTIYSRLVGK